MCRNAWLGSTLFCLLAPLVAAAGAEPPAAADTAQDEQLLKGASVGTDGPGLLAFFRKRVPTEEDRRQADELVARLGSKTFREREKASKGLIALGLAARPALARAAKDKDAEIARRAQECLDTITRANSVEVEAAAVRLLGVRRPDGGCGALLEFLPSVRDAGVEEETLAALLVLGIRGGKADDALARSLDDKEPSRRAAAALVLGHSGTDALKDKVRGLLKTEADAKVRLRAAQGLLAARDKNAVPVLLALVGDAPADVAREAHDLLGGVAGDKAPAESPADGAEGRKKSKAAWDAWWKDNESKLDLAKADVDLPWRSANQRARSVATQFVNALTKSDAKRLKNSTDVPFSLSGFMVMKTRQEFDQMFGQLLQPQRPKIEFSPPQLIGLEEYLKNPGAQRLKDFLGGLPRSEIRVVTMTVKTQGMREEKAVLIVRVRGGKAHVVGIGEAK
ncbi:MAG: HEAT repeat domain-containing protein [Planctomycetes bacterium]|nr:HEAT repeat domain-containing protein [Planctomycetota bacterium]